MTTKRRTRASSLPPADGRLGEAFAGLTAALPERRTTPVPEPAQDQADPTEELVPASVSLASGDEPSPEQPAPPAVPVVQDAVPVATAAAGRGTRVQVALHVAVALTERLTEYRTTHGLTNAGAVMHAINQVGAHLQGAQALDARPDAVSFFAPQAPARTARTDGRARGPLTLSMTSTERDQLDRVVSHLGFGSRSALVEAALDQFFTE